MASTEVAPVNVDPDELVENRHDARMMELSALRKESEERLAEEERLLCRELQDMNNMIADKLKDEELMESNRLPLDVEHSAEIKALEALLKLEQDKKDQLELEAKDIESLIQEVEGQLDRTNAKLVAVKEVTAWDVDMVMARDCSASLNEFSAKQKVMDKLQEEKNTVKLLSDRLTLEFEELTGFLKEQEDLDEKIAAAQNHFKNEANTYDEICADERALGLLIKKKERQISEPQDEYKDIRYLEHKKRAAHTAFLSARDNNGGNSLSLIAGESRLRQLETTLATINTFLQIYFSSSESLIPMEEVDSSSEVQVSLFNDLVMKLKEKRDFLRQQTDQMEGLDTSIEQLQLKTNVLRGVLISNNSNYKLYSEQQEKDIIELASQLEILNRDFQEQEIEATRQNQNLRRQLYR